MERLTRFSPQIEFLPSLIVFLLWKFILFENQKVTHIGIALP